MKNYIIGLFFLLLISVISFAQDKSNQVSSDNLEENKVKGEKIIADYHLAIGYQKTNPAQKNLSLSEEYTFKGPNFDVTTIEEFYLSGNLLRQNTKAIEAGRKFSRLAVLNGDKYYRDFITNAPPELRRDTLNKEQQLLDGEIRLLKSRVFVRFFPITLDESWYNSVDLRFLGIAETKTEKANVLESKIGKNKTYQLLFDTKSHLLVMWIITTLGNDEKPQKRTYYFDDYKVMSGVKVATKIEVYQDNEIIETRSVKSFKANSTFPTDFFELK